MFDPPTRGIRLERSRKKRPYYREKLLWCHQKTNNRMQPLTINFQLALSINIDAYGWLLTNSVIQIHMTIFQHLLHQNMNVVVLFISYPTIPSSLIKFGANYWFVNGQPYVSIFIESRECLSGIRFGWYLFRRRLKWNLSLTVSNVHHKVCLIASAGDEQHTNEINFSWKWLINFWIHEFIKSTLLNCPSKFGLCNLLFGR